MTALEVLFDARIVDENTPISTDGQGFRALGQWAGLMEHLIEVKDALGRGEDPWPESLPPAARIPMETADVMPENLIGNLIAHAGAMATGIMLIDVPDGDVRIDLKDGKVVSVSTSAPELVLSEYLIEAGLIDEAALAKAELQAPSVGGDLGAALVASGQLQPHVYFDALIGWAKVVLSRAALEATDRPSFETCDIPAPSVPLGFERFRLPVDIVRDGFDIDKIRDALLPKKRCPVVISQVDGVSIDDCKLQPKELRVLNRVNGVRTLQDLIDELGGSDSKEQAVLRAVFFAEQAGFIVFAEDAATRKEQAEAANLELLFQKMSQQNDFEILDIDEKSSNADVRDRYTNLAMLYHPDKISSDADASLLDVRRRLFALVSGAYKRQESEDSRYRYAHDLEQGASGGTGDPQQVKDALQAETAFKKAEILVRVRKYEEALEQIDEAIRLNDADVEFKIQREYIFFLNAARTGDVNETAKAAIRNVTDMMKNNETIASGYLVLGHLNKAINKLTSATRNFEKVLEYDPDHPVANQEVRLANARRERGNPKKKKKGWI
ncbi:MAG: J domain-containing protein [Myxococcota bacterium]